MKTAPFTIAAEDLTGPSVLNDQARERSSGRVLCASPVKPGPPRNIGQSFALPVAANDGNAKLAAQISKTKCKTRQFELHFGLRIKLRRNRVPSDCIVTRNYCPGESGWQINNTYTYYFG